ncbi:hypothetical protein [Sharpea azabuensis]|uniref:hypothetical protein n=1 Tax=Sharpea azabuensis TaxID=322505 RepID=UPI0013DBC183|nr:hypothetical protein [Sharpea azabuensis]
MKKNVLKKAIPLTVAATMMNVVPVAAYDKDETVYTKVDGDGNVTYQVVSEQLKSSKKEEIKDHSDLSNIKNISGDEKYKKDGNDLTWKSKGDDIFYQGKTTRQLPITVETSYKLDGQEISPKDASGKKGHVEISFKYTNNDKHEYNGKTLYTPFTIALATTLNSDNNKNVTINNGKVVNNGENNIIVGVAAPGLYESLNLDQLKSFDEIKIEFDTTDLDIKSFYSVATPKLATADDINNMFDKIDGSFDDLNKLKDATNQLVTGTSDLSKGAKTLSDGTKTFNSGLVTANSGAGLLTKNSKSLRDGASQLASGLGTLSNGSGTLVDGLKKAASGSDQLTKGLAKAKAGTDEMNAGTGKLSSMKDQLTQAAFTQVAYGMQASAGTKYYATMNAQLATNEDGIAAQNAALMSAIQNAAGATGANNALQTQVNKLRAEITEIEASVGVSKGQENQIAKAAKNTVIATAIKEGKAPAGLTYEALDTLIAKATAGAAQAAAGAKQAADAATNYAQAGDAANAATYKAKAEQLEKAANDAKNQATQLTGLKQTADTTSTKVETAVQTLTDVKANVEATLNGDATVLGSNENVKHLKDVANNTAAGLKTSEEGKVAEYLFKTDAKTLAKEVATAYTAYKNGTKPTSKGAQIVTALNADPNNKIDGKTIFETIDSVASQTGDIDKLVNGITSLSDGLNKLYAGSSQLSSGLDAAVNKLPTLTNGISALVSGSSKLNAGTKEYTEGVDKLAGGVSQLTSAFTKIVNGSAQLSTGADKLASGMSEYKTTGIDKLTELADTLNGDSDTAKQLTKYADEYTYTATNKDANYTTKFVYIVQE